MSTASAISSPAGRNFRPHRAVRSVALAVELALIVVIAWLAAQAMWWAVYRTDAMDLKIDAPALAGPETASSGLDRAPSAAGLFQAFDPQEAADTPAPPETRLNLVLRGVRAGADPSAGSAVIESPGQGQRALAAGAELVAGVRLVEIHPDRVIINRRGARETVYLREEGRRETAANAAAAAAPAPPQTAAAGALSVQDWVEGVSLEPALVGGVMTGLRVRPASRADVLRAAGLEPGDIIRTVNSTVLDGPGAMGAVAETFESASQVRLDVERDGERITLTIPLDRDG